MKKTREESIQIVRQAAGEIIFIGKEVFEDTLYKTRYKGIAESLKAYKAALHDAYKILSTNKEKQNAKGIDERMMEDVKQLVYDSYFFEIEKQLNGDNLDKKSKQDLKSIMINEMIQAERLSFMELFAEKNIPKDREALPRLMATLQDFAIKRFRQEKKSGTSFIGAMFNGGLSGFVSTELSEPFFLN